jgi:hypothetical protein
MSKNKINLQILAKEIGFESQLFALEFGYSNREV